MRLLIRTLLLLLLTNTVLADTFILSSKDIKNGEFMPMEQEYNGFGCQGKNISPHLAWHHVPAGTKSFALTLFDPDAPTGSGWWHWQIVNIPAQVHQLKKNAGNPGAHIAPESSLQIKNDFGEQGFGGACPPKGDKAHRYVFTIYALSVDKLNLDKDASNALVGYMIRANSLASASITALYAR